MLVSGKRLISQKKGPNPREIVGVPKDTPGIRVRGLDLNPEP